MKKKEKEKNDNFKILVHRLVSQILIRKDAQWSGLEARRITAVAHQFLFLNTEPVEFRKLTSAVYYVGKYVDTTPSLMRTLSYDWKEIEEHSYKLLKGHVDNSLVDRFINEVKSRIISYDFDHYKVVDWVEYINKIFSGLEINDENIDLSSKLELSSVIDDFLDLRFEALANYAAENQELNVDDIILSIYELTLNKKNETLARVYNNSPVTLGEEGMSYYIHQINFRS
ncbi:MAG TPA: hypothetical protein ENK78_07695, partial [Thiothrix sp.]|nr:hypothetical protein [Thiothrix sp.]